MIYTAKCVFTIDTKTNKLIVVNADSKRIAITPVTRGGTDVHVVVDDRPAGQALTALDLVRYLVQNLYDKQQVRRIAKEVGNAGTTPPSA